MNVSRPKIDVKMHRVNIKTSRESSASSKSSKQLLSELLKILSNLSSISTGQILNEMNDSSSKYFESSKTITSASTSRIFNLNSTNETLIAFENFDDSIEKIDFVWKKSILCRKKSVSQMKNRLNYHLILYQKMQKKRHEKEKRINHRFKVEKY